MGEGRKEGRVERGLAISWTQARRFYQFNAPQPLHTSPGSSAPLLPPPSSTASFLELLSSSPQAATRTRWRSFVIIAMDRPFAKLLAQFDDSPGLLLPRVASGVVTIDVSLYVVPYVSPECRCQSW